MRTTIGIAEAKTHLSEVIDRVQTGETIIIARNGEPVAELRPLRSISAKEMVANIRALAARVTERNKGKEKWPPNGQRIRDIAHDLHRF